MDNVKKKISVVFEMNCQEEAAVFVRVLHRMSAGEASQLDRSMFEAATSRIEEITEEN